MNPMRRSFPLSKLATGCVLVCVTILFIEHIAAPRLRPTDYMISEYANAGGAPGAAGVLALGLLGTSFLLAAGLALQAGATGTVLLRGALVVFLTIAGLGLFVAAACPTQAVRGVVPPGMALTVSGHLHDLGSGASQLAIFGAAFVSLRLFAAERRFRHATLALITVGLVLGPTLALVDAGARGLRQRALVAAACAWELGLITTLQRRRSRRRIARCREP